MTIGCEAVVSHTTFPVYNPATNEILAQAPEATHAQLKEAIAAAQAAFPAWSALDWSARAAYLTRYA